MALAIASPALAYDTGPHSELTRDAMASEGFGNDAIGVAQVNNWFVDLYEQAGKNPYTGHGGFWKRLLTGAIRDRALARRRDRRRGPQPLRQLDVVPVQHRRRARTSGTGSAAPCGRSRARPATRTTRPSC